MTPSCHEEKEPCGCKINQTIPAFIEMENGDHIHLSEKAIKRLPIPEFEYCPTHSQAFELAALNKDARVDGYRQAIEDAAKLVYAQQYVKNFKDAEKLVEALRALLNVPGKTKGETP